MMPTETLKIQIKQSFSPDDTLPAYRQVKCQKQVGNHDCGLFAIAFAIELLTNVALTFNFLMNIFDVFCQIAFVRKSFSTSFSVNKFLLLGVAYRPPSKHHLSVRYVTGLLHHFLF